VSQAVVRVQGLTFGGGNATVGAVWPRRSRFPGIGRHYTFRFYTGDTLEYEESVPYTLKTVGFPTDVVARREGNDPVVEWTPPSDSGPSMDGKVLLFPDGGEVISQVYNWGTRNARLPDIPLSDGTTTLVSVTLTFNHSPSAGGYAYSEYVRLVW